MTSAPLPTSPQQLSDTVRRVAISGASGFLGSALADHLRGLGISVQRLRRVARTQPPDIAWDPTTGRIDVDGLDGVDAVVNLAGESLARRWTSQRKRSIRDSRVVGTTALARALATLPRPPRVFLSGSAIGIYGERGNEELDEESDVGTGFLADVVTAWEQATEPAAITGIHVALLRTGLVLSPQGGALKRMVLPFALGLGGRIASGEQWMSWIGLRDWVRAVLFLMRSTRASGPVNLVAPNPVRNATFVDTLAAALHRPALVPLPSAAVSLLFGEMGRATLLVSQRVLPRRLADCGFDFEQPSLAGALRAEGVGV